MDDMLIQYFNLALRITWLLFYTHAINLSLIPRFPRYSDKATLGMSSSFC